MIDSRIKGKILDDLLEELAERIAKKIGDRPHLDDLVDRKSAPISKRAWDANAGKPDGFKAFRDGRRVVAKRADVLAWLERARVLRPDTPILDEDEKALASAGVRFTRKAAS